MKNISLITFFSLAISSTSPAFAGCKPQTLRLAIDVGHSAGAGGATSARGRPEYAFNVEAAAAIQAALWADGIEGARILAQDGPNPSLASRVAAAEAMNAELFLSVHHDSVQERFLRPWTPPGSERVQPMSRHAKGYSLFISEANGDPAASLAFARAIGQALQDRGFAYTDHHAAPIPGEKRALVDTTLGVYRFDGLFILRRTRMPAVLFEVGVIKHPEEETALRSPQTQGLVAAAVVDAARRYCMAVP